MNRTPDSNNSGKPMEGSYLCTRILGRLWLLAFSHILQYAPFSKEPNPLQGCDPYGPEILSNKLL